jgi:peptidoglycan/xylan/chitin deacetylase (PgdA/CDA1 family)
VFTAPAGTATVTLFHSITGVGFLQTDDISITPYTPPPPPPFLGIVPNGDVEVANPLDATQPVNWRHDSWGQTTASFSWANDSAHSGTHSNRIDVSAYTDGGAKWSFDPQPVTEGSAYRYSTWYQSDRPTELLAVYTLTNGSTSYQWLADVPAAASWTQATATFTAPQLAASITVFHSIAGVGFLQTDETSVTRLEDRPATYLGIVPNGDLEKPLLLDPSAPANWRHDNWGLNTTTFSYPQVGAHSGANSTRIDVSAYTDGGAKWSFDPQPIAPLKSYKYSSWYKSDRTTEILAVYTKTDGSTAYQLLANVAPASAWTQFATTFTAPAGAAQVTIFQTITGVGFVQTDDFSITPFQPRPLARPLVSITFDDGTEPHYTNAFPKLQASGLFGTFYIITNYINDPGPPAQLTSAQIQAMHAAGMEIGSHSVSHPHLTTLTSAQQDTQLQNSKQVLQTLIGSPVTNFASPYGDYNDAVLAKTKAVYSTHRTIDDGYNQADTTDLNRLKAKMVFNTTTTAEVQAWIDEAKADGSWLILVYHDIYENPATYDVSPANFSDQIDVVKNSGVAVKTVADAAAEVAPQLTP